MPVYYIYHDESAFTSAQKQSIANGIADAHVAATDAPRFFVKVAFVGRAHGDLFSNGAAAPDMVQVVGNIRAGRDSAHRYKLLTLLDDVIVRNAGGKKFLVEVTLMERPAEVRSIFYHYCHLLVADSEDEVDIEDPLDPIDLVTRISSSERTVSGDWQEKVSRDAFRVNCIISKMRRYLGLRIAPHTIQRGNLTCRCFQPYNS